MSPSNTDGLPFSGIRVLDLSQLAAGPLVTQMLSDFGAEVIKVESEAYILSGGGSRVNRREGATSLNVGYFHNKFNTSALSITLDLKRTEAVEIFMDLVGKSDIVIDNLRPTVTSKWGLTYERLSSINPRIIMVQMPTMGMGGPRDFYGGVSWGIQAMAGLNAISGYPDKPPVSPTPWSHPDTSCNPFHGMVAVLAALHSRNVTGKGQYIEISQYESTINFMGPLILEYTANGRISPRTGNRDAGFAPQGVYPCQGHDRWCAISIGSDQHWSAFCRILGDARLSDSRFDTFLGRQQHADELDAVIGEWTELQSAEVVMQRLLDEGIPAGVLNGADDLLNHDAQLRSREHWISLEHPELGSVVTESWGYRLSSTAPRQRRHAPLLGEHNDYVYREILGLSEERIDDYMVEGIIQ
jgi:benzylsuccinate CoA-transferase BbsF subunit